MNRLTNRRAHAALVTLTAACLTLSACATKPDRRGPPPDDRKPGQQTRSSGTFLLPISALFVSMDTNNDKATSRAEMGQGIQSEWSSFSGQPSAVYFAQWGLKTLGSTDATPNFLGFDRDFNGVISDNEFSGLIEQEFDRLDKNNDGRLERSEMIVAFAAPRGERSRKGGQEGRGKGGGRPPAR